MQYQLSRQLLLGEMAFLLTCCCVKRPVTLTGLFFNSGLKADQMLFYLSFNLNTCAKHIEKSTEMALYSVMLIAMY